MTIKGFRMLWLFPLLVLPITLTSRIAQAGGPNKKDAGTWSINCNIPFGKSLGVAVWGKASLHIATACNELKVQSHWSPAKYKGEISAVPKDQRYLEIRSGQIKNWSWQLMATSAVEKNTASNDAALTKSPNPTHGPRVSWPTLFQHFHSVYRYVLNKVPPASRFSIYFFPARMKLHRTLAVSTRRLLDLPFFFPYRTSPSLTSANHLSSTQSAYLRVLQVTCFEYMHALFFTKKLTVPNLLSQSIADSVTCTALKILDLQSDPHYSITLPSAKSLLAMAKNKKSAYLHQGYIDGYGIILATANMARALGGYTKQVTISAGDRSKLLRLLKLARAMLQQPFDFTKRKLYPLKRLASVPTYTGTPKDISARQ